MSDTGRPVAAQRTKGGFRYAAATLLLLGGISTLTQMISVASLGLPVRVEWSTGGLVALIAAAWFWIRCRSWARWRKWVWLPAVLTVVVAFATVNLQVASAREVSAKEAAAKHAAMCNSANAELARTKAALAALLDKTWAYRGDPGEREVDWRSQPPSSTTSSRMRDLTGSPSEREVWAFYVAASGPQLETDIPRQEAAYAAECGAE